MNWEFGTKVSNNVLYHTKSCTVLYWTCTVLNWNGFVLYWTVLDLHRTGLALYWTGLNLYYTELVLYWTCTVLDFTYTGVKVNGCAADIYEHSKFYRYTWTNSNLRESLFRLLNIKAFYFGCPMYVLIIYAFYTHFRTFNFVINA